MKNHKLTLVLMAGLPGAGKTTLAYALAERFQWQVIDKDKLKDVLLKQGLEHEEAAREAYERSFAKVRDVLIEKQTSVILDTAALYRFILDKVIEIAACAENIEIKVILCLVDRDLRNSRLRDRKEQPTNLDIDPATTGDYLHHFRHLPAEKLILYTSTPLGDCLAKAEAYIKG